MTALLAGSRDLARHEISVGLVAFAASSSTLAVLLAVAADLLARGFKHFHSARFTIHQGMQS